MITENYEQVTLLINDKLCQCQTDKDWNNHQAVEILANNKNGQSVFVATEFWYDPKYGTPITYDDMVPDHRAEIEHMLVIQFMSGDDLKRWQVIGRIART